MSFVVLDAGGSRTITGGIVRQAGVERRLLRVDVWDGGALRRVADFADPLSASISPNYATGSANSSTVTTGSVTASPTGGLAPFAYSWVYFGGDVAAPLSANMASTAFRADAVGVGVGAETIFRVTVTDSIGQTATATVTATFFNFGGGFEP